MPEATTPGYTTAPESLHGLPSFLNFLSNLPDAQHVVEALLHGPLLQFHARGVMLWALDGTVLRAIANVGHDPSEIMRWSSVDTAMEVPVANAVQSCTITIVSRAALIAGLADALGVPVESGEVDALFFGYDEPFTDDGGDVVDVPLLVDGVPIGALGISTSQRYDWQPSDLALLSSIGSALALWLHHPDTPVSHPIFEDETPQFIAMALTPRQKEILTLIELGKSNAFIATKLGYSTSTIKQELQRIMIALDVGSRSEAAYRARSLGLLNT